MIGIYGIFRRSDDKCMYVGQSKDIRNRIKHHLNGHTHLSFNKEQFYGDVIEEHFINDKQFRLEREAYWINELNPELNKMKDRHNSEEQKKKQSERMNGKNNPMYGKNSEDYMTPESIKERRKKLSEVLKDRTWINNGEITKYVKPDELDKYIQDGWKLGRLAWKRNS